MAASKTDATFEGMRVTLLDGTKDRIAKVQKTSYKTVNGVSIKAANIAKKGRGLIELDAGGGATKKASTKKASTKKTTTTSKSTTSKSTKKSAKGNTDVSKTDSSKMTRRELVTALVDAEVLRVRSDAKGVPVEELREMVDGIGKKGKKSAKSGAAKKSTKKSTKTESTSESKPARRRKGKKSEAAEEESGKKVTRRKSKKTEEAPAKSKKSTATKSTKTKAKPVKTITDELARSVETSLGEHIASFIRNTTGHNFTVACVGGVFNEERLTVQVGLLPTNASDEDIEAYAADMEDAENKATSAKSNESAGAGATHLDMLRSFVSEETVSDARLQRAIDGWESNFDELIEPKLGDEVGIGTKLDYEDEEAIVLGFSDQKGKVVLYLTESDQVKLVSIAKVVRMEIIEDEEDQDVASEDDDLDTDEEDDDLEDTDEEEDDEEGDEDDDLEDTEGEEDDDSDDDDEEEDFDDEEDDEEGDEDLGEDDDEEEDDDDDSDEEEDDEEGDDDDFDDFDDEL